MLRAHTCCVVLLPLLLHTQSPHHGVRRPEIYCHAVPPRALRGSPGLTVGLGAAICSDAAAASTAAAAAAASAMLSLLWCCVRVLCC